MCVNDSGEMEYSRILNQAIVIGQIIGGFMLAAAIAQMIWLCFFSPFFQFILYYVSSL